jgi:hypothetical protein
VDEPNGKQRCIKWEVIFQQEADARADDAWKAELDAERSRHGRGGNKLRTYATFKDAVELEPYLWRVKEIAHRRLIARLRMGVAPLRIELGRYETSTDSNGRSSVGIPVERRLCQCCKCRVVEDEAHFVTECSAYARERKQLWAACDQCPVIADARARGEEPRVLLALIMREAKVASSLGYFLAKAFRIRNMKFIGAELVGSVGMSAGR